jgi:Mrp family chromosome partitioning ATPase
MSNDIFAALEQATTQLSSREEGEIKDVKKKLTKSYLQTNSIEVEKQMIGLYRSISALIQNRKRWGRTIQFVSSRNGEGCSTICREFAKIVVSQLDMSVLLLDADPDGKQMKWFDLTPEHGWKDAVLHDKPVKWAFRQVGDSKLYISQITLPGESITRLIHTPEIEAIIEDLKRDFDFILLDTAPAMHSPDSLALSHKVDGVVMVVEAESTRWQIVKDTKEKIEMRGGNVLGVVFNKRQFYIPQFIYKRFL